MSADECGMVAEFVILESQSKLCHLDMRLLDNAFRDYLQWRGKHSNCHWQTLVATRLDGRKDELAVIKIAKDRQQDEDLRSLRQVWPIPHDVGGPSGMVPSRRKSPCLVLPLQEGRGRRKGCERVRLSRILALDSWLAVLCISEKTK